jgi:hypothetical protein
LGFRKVKITSLNKKKSKTPSSKLVGFVKKMSKKFVIQNEKTLRSEFLKKEVEFKGFNLNYPTINKLISK